MLVRVKKAFTIKKENLDENCMTVLSNHALPLVPDELELKADCE